MREEFDRSGRYRRYDRITPACAGRIGLTLLYGGDDRDHPRMCGKNRFRTGDVTDVWGSPPHVREEFKNVSTGQFEYGITPAHAGRISLGFGNGTISRDHPRACGKNICQQRIALCKQGSPPRMREESSPLQSAPERYRITPAHAGRITSLFRQAWIR